MKHFNKESLDYSFISKFEAGISLLGSEAKSLRTQNPQFQNSKIEMIGSVPYLVNLKIPTYKYSHGQIIDATRPKPLLLNKKEIAKIISYRHQKYMIIPIAIFTKGKWFKVEIGIGRKIKKYEKREKIKQKEFQHGGDAR
jgi:SsrA-binding protein